METLLSYDPGNLLLFSPRVYWALVATQNSDWWPVAILSPVAGLLLVWLLLRGGPRSSRLGLVLTGLAWWFVTWSFLWQQYRAINWAVDWAIAPLVALGGLLLVLAARPGRPARRPHRYRTGLALVIWGTLVHPLGFLLDNRGPGAADSWLLFPDPLAVTTLGLALVVLDGWRLALVVPVPLLWAVIGGATLLGLGSAIGWGMLAAAAAALLGWMPLSGAGQSQRGTCWR